MQNRNKGSKNSRRGTKNGNYRGSNKKSRTKTSMGNGLKPSYCRYCPFPFANSLENKKHTVLSLQEAHRELNIC
jgi:hypothetical protein